MNHNHFIIIRRPNLKGKSPLWYDTEDVFQAWSLFINVSQSKPQLINVTTFR